MVDNKDNSIKKKDWCHSCGTYTEKYMFYDIEATQNTGTDTFNLSVAQDFKGNEYVHNSIEKFCKGFINNKFEVQMKCFFLFPNLKEQQKSGRLPFTVS